jgi:hypothetical protein
VDRRYADRRVSRLAVRWPDRRTGFDRRGGPSRWGRVVLAYARRPAVIAAVLGTVVLLNAADLWLTVRALDRGAVEVNPVMRVLLETRPVTAAVFKLAVGVGVAAVLWRLRRYRRILEVSLVLLAGFLMLTGYHLVGAVALSG